MDVRPAASELRLGRITLQSGVSPNALRPGVVESFTVSRRLNQLQIQLTSARFTIIARDDGLLEKGSSVRLRLETVSPTIRFKLVSEHVEREGSIVASLRQWGYAESPAVVQLAQVLASSGRALSRETIDAVVRLFRRLRTPVDTKRSRARALVEVADRGIGAYEVVGASVAALVEWLSAGGSGYERNDDRNSEPEQSADEIATVLRRATKQPRDPLQLLNVLLPRSPLHWIHIPIGAIRGSTRVDATLRIAWDVKKQQTVRAVLVVGGTQTDEMIFEIGLPDAIVRAVSPQPGAGDREALEELLASLHSSAEPRTIDHDGIDLEPVSLPIDGFERYG